MLTNLIFLALLCSGSVFLAVRLKRSFEETLPITAMGMVLIVFVFGVFGFLKAGAIVCLIAAAALYITSAVFMIKMGQFKQFVRCFITPGMVVFVLVFLGLSYYNLGKLACVWDEFSHWADIVKVMVTLDDFGTNVASNSAFQSYPPGMSVFQYILQKITVWINPANPFSEWRLYVAYQVFSMIPFIPMLKDCTFRRPLPILLCCIALFITPLLFYNDLFNSIYIDPYLGLVSGAGLLLILLWEKKDWLYHVLIWLYCSMLVLAKDVGMMFALFLAAAYVLDNHLRARDAEWFTGKRIVPFAGAALAVAVPKLLWRWELWTSGAEIRFSGKIDFEVLLNILVGKDESYRNTVLKNYENAFFNGGLTLGHTSVVLNYFALIVILLLGLYLLRRMYQNKEPRRSGTVKVVMYVSGLQIVVYSLGLCIIYMFKFSEYEAVRLASMFRYLNMVLLAAWIVIAGVSCHAVSVWFPDRAAQLCLLSALLVITPMKSMINFTNGSSIEQAAALRESYEPLKDLINKYCDGNDKIYFISQDDSGFDYWVTRFNARPNSLNPSYTWAIGESDYQGGMYTQPKTAEQWREELLNEYDFVAIYALNSYFYEHYSDIFENAEDIAANALYRIDRDTGLLYRCR